MDYERAHPVPDNTPPGELVQCWQVTGAPEQKKIK
jgi:hypothetical protein